MSDTISADTDDLAARVRALEAENDRLRSAAAADAGDVASRHASGRWRAWVSALCIIIATILVPVSIVTAWARVQLVDEDAFTATLAPLASDAAVQSMIIDETMDAVNAKVDFAQITSDVIDGVAELDLPPVAISGLQLLKQPAADGLESLVERAVTRVVTSDAFADVWATATRAAHRALVTTATSDGGGIVVRTEDGVGIQLGAIVERVKQNLTDRGIGAAALIPAVDRVVILGTGENLALVRTSYAVATAVGFWLPLLTLGLFALGVLIARRRSVAFLGTGAGLLVGGGSLAIGISIGSVAVGSIASQAQLSPSALDVIYGRISDGMAHTAAVVAVIGVVVMALAWVFGRSTPARAVRTGTGSMNTGIRRALRARGVDTGAFGGWMYRQRGLVRAVIAVLAVVWLLALRPLTFGDLVVVLVVGVVVWWLTELVQRRVGEDAALAPDAAAQEAAAAADAADSTASPDGADALPIAEASDVAEIAPIAEAPDVEVPASTAPPAAAKKPRGGTAPKG